MPENILSWSVLFYVSEWLIRLVMLGVVIERHPPRTAMTWLLVIFFLPWAGLILYLLIGENRLPHHRLVQRKALLKRLEKVRHRISPHEDSVPGFFKKGISADCPAGRETGLYAYHGRQPGKTSGGDGQGDQRID